MLQTNFKKKKIITLSKRYILDSFRKHCDLFAKIQGLLSFIKTKNK